MPPQRPHQHQPTRPSTVTPAEHTAIGALGGTVEVCIMQPLVGIKNALQVRARVCALSARDNKSKKIGKSYYLAPDLDTPPLSPSRSLSLLPRGPAQEGRPIPRHPAHLYRGLLMNIVSMAPITASQVRACDWV